MDAAELALMLADLDNSRRDGLSAPDDRRGGPSSRDLEKAQFAEEETARRQEILAGPATNQRHAAIKAWNTTSSFSRDETAEQTTNWADGQSHRLLLKRKIGDDERGAHTTSYQHERRPRIQQVELPRPVRDPNRPRAPSPRSGGVKRWINGVAVESTAPAVQKPVARPMSSTPRPTPSPAPKPAARSTSSASRVPPSPIRKSATPSLSRTASVVSVPPISTPPSLAPSSAPKRGARLTSSTASSAPPISKAASVAPSAPNLPAAYPLLTPQAITSVAAPRPVARTAPFSLVVSHMLPQTQKAREPAIKEEASKQTESLLSPSSQTGKARQPAIANGSLNKTEALASPPDSSERPRLKSYRESALDLLTTAATTAATAAKVALVGIFSVNYYDSEGGHRGNSRVEIAAPVNVNINVHAKGEYNPLQMAAEMKALAEYMGRHF